MDTNQAKQLTKQHGPTAVIAAVAVAVIKLSGSSSSTVTPPSSLQLTAERVAGGDPALPHGPDVARARRDDGIVTRLVSCGGRGARVVGDGEHALDNIGTVTLGTESKGTCTVVFETVAAPRHCAINGGHLAKALSTEIVVDHIDGATFAYRCEQ